MWVKTYNGTLINTDKISQIRIETAINSCNIIAMFGDDRCIIISFSSTKKAQIFLSRFFNCIKSDAKHLDAQLIGDQIDNEYK